MNASQIMQQLNQNALHAREDGWDVFIEDVKDPDGRWYRLEYRCKPDGSSATAWVRHNPWVNNPFSYGEAHLSSSNEICIGSGVSGNDSPYGLGYTVKRARFWCMGYSFLREHGLSEARRQIAGW